MRVVKRIIEVIRNFKRKQEQKKYNFVFNLGFKYFYDIQETQSVKDEVNIPDFLDDFKRKSLAQYLTAKQMKKIMDNNSLNHCYKSAKKYAKENKILVQDF